MVKLESLKVVWSLVVVYCSSQVSLTHPLLLSSPPSALLLKLEHLFPTDYSTVVMATAEAHTPTLTKVIRRRGYVTRHVGGGPYRLQQQTSGRSRAVPDQCYLGLSLFPLSLEGDGATDQDNTAANRDTMVDNQDKKDASDQDTMADNQDKENVANQDKITTDQDTNCSSVQDIDPGPCAAVNLSMTDLLKLKDCKDFVLNLVLGACQYRVVNQEMRTLPQSLQTLVEGAGREGGREVQVGCLRLLCWLSRLVAAAPEREEVEIVRDAVSQLVLSLLHACFLASHTRQTAHYCSRLLVSLFRSVCVQ